MFSQLQKLDTLYHVYKIYEQDSGRATYELPQFPTELCKIYISYNVHGQYMNNYGRKCGDRSKKSKYGLLFSAKYISSLIQASSYSNEINIY